MKLDLQQAFNALCGELGYLEVQKKLLEQQIAAKHDQLAALNKVRALATNAVPASPAAEKDEAADEHAAPAPAPEVGPAGADRAAAAS